MFGLGTQARIARLESRVRTQQATIDLLCERAGISPRQADPLGTVDDEERRLIAAGKQIQAIKHHRERTGSSLIEAKQAVDAASGGV